MDKKRLEIRVGAFVLICLVLLGLLLTQLSKSSTLFRGKYYIVLKSTGVGGLKRRSNVLMAGVPVGMVSQIELAEGATNVMVRLQIYKDYPIHRDARFVIEMSGFLGDQFVTITPTANQAPFLTNNEVVTCEEPFNLQEVARSASGFIHRLDLTAAKLDAAVADVRRLVLNEETLSNLSATIGNARLASERAVASMVAVNDLVNSNRPPISDAMSNLVLFSGEIKQFGDMAQGLVSANSNALSVSMKNIESTTETIKNVADDLRAGKGLAGRLIEDQAMADDMAAIARNLAITSSNLNRVGLWGILWRQKTPAANQPGGSPMASPHQRDN